MTTPLNTTPYTSAWNRYGVKPFSSPWFWTLGGFFNPFASNLYVQAGCEIGTQTLMTFGTHRSTVPTNESVLTGIAALLNMVHTWGGTRTGMATLNGDERQARIERAQERRIKAGEGNVIDRYFHRSGLGVIGSAIFSGVAGILSSVFTHYKGPGQEWLQPAGLWLGQAATAGYVWANTSGGRRALMGVGKYMDEDVEPQHDLVAAAAERSLDQKATAALEPSAKGSAGS